MTTIPTDEHSIRVALVDDQALFRTGIRMLVDSQPDLRVRRRGGQRCATASSSSDATRPTWC